MIRLLAGLAAALAVAPAVLAAAAVELPDAPAPVVLWFGEEAPGVVQTSENSGLPPETLVTVEVGEAVAVGTWSEDFLAGRSTAEPVVASGEWVAPVTIDGTGIGAVVAAGGEAGAIADHRVIWDDALGAALTGNPTHDFVLDPQSAGWFRLGSEELTPVTAEAKDLLAGSLPIADYQPFLVERYRADDNPAPPPEAQDPDRLRPVLVTAGIALAVLLSVGVVVWIRRPEAP